ncbi:MAG: NAD(P)H-hydrate epimerase, partial [Acidimicrobiia bacterium]|nr:NAD(P)H-hydrate epimerase [Acidimicrobiia bacterium]
MEVLLGRPIPALTEQQMREVDRIMIDDLGIELMQMMENAGRNLAALALGRFNPASVVVMAGPGGNGGGGLVAARHLANRGVLVHVALSRPADEFGGVPAHQLAILQRLRIATMEGATTDADLIIDALIGYSLRGDPRGDTRDLIDWANQSGSPVLSLDTPSGLNVTTGEAATPCVQATATMTLALPKVGLLEAPQVGELWLADISVPPSVYAAFGIEVGNLFAEDTIIRVPAADRT